MLILSVSATSATAQTNDADRPLKGKKLWVFGDSYVKNHRCPESETWHCKAAEALGMEYHNLGRNGSCIAFDREKEGFGEAMTVRYHQIEPDADYILIIAGHNDAEKAAAGPEAWNQFAAGLEELLTNLQKDHPSAKIGIVTPWAVARPMFAEVIRELKEAGARHGIPVLDMAYTSGIKVNDLDFRKKYFQGGGIKDTAHLNNAGHDMLVPYGTAFIRLLAAQP